MDPLLEIRDAMRALGIRKLSIELEPNGPLAFDRSERDTEPPTVDDVALERPEKGPSVCQWEGCNAPNGGMFGGVAPEYCERHALASAGVK